VTRRYREHPDGRLAIQYPDVDGSPWVVISPDLSVTLADDLPGTGWSPCYLLPHRPITYHRCLDRAWQALGVALLAAFVSSVTVRDVLRRRRETWGDA
jgi:hypothetical protein